MKHTFYLILLLSLNINSIANAQNSGITINELMASNTTTVQDLDGEFDDWIELYNNTSEAKDISGWFLSDNPDNYGKWEFPEGSVIGADNYLIIWADEDGMQLGIHASFKLSAGGEVLFLANRDTLVEDQVTFGQQEEDMGYARIPNGTGDFVIQSPTFERNNESVSIRNVLVEPQFTAYPNPATQWLDIQTDEVGEQQVAIYNLLGQAVKEFTFRNQKTINVSTWDRGVYILKMNDGIRKIIIE